MKRRVLSLALALMMVLTLVPAAVAAEDKPQRGVLTYTEHIKPQYEDANLFTEDLAAVKKNGKWGYIDHDNKVVIPFQYELAYDFSEGYAIVAKSVRQETHEVGDYDGENIHTESYNVYEMGFIDKAGKYTAFMAFARDELDQRTGGTEKLEVPEWNLNSRAGFCFHNGFAVINNGLFRTNGSQVDMMSENGYDEYYPLGSVNEGLVPVSLMGGYGLNACGWADTSGNIVKFYLDDEMPGYVISNVYPFNQGLAPVWTYHYDGQTDEEDYLLGFIDRNFQWAIQPQFGSYFYTGSFTYQMFGDTGLSMVEKGGLYGAIDKTGAVKIPFQYEELWPVGEGLITFMEGGKYGYLNAATLETAIPAQYEKASGFENGMAVVYDGTKAFLIDRRGNPIPGADSLDAKVYFREDESGGRTVYSPEEYVVIEKDGKYGFGHIEYLQPLPEKDEMHDWAYDEVVAAIENDLVPGYLQNLYLNDIKRGEMCDVVIQAMEAVLDKDIVEIVKDKTGEDINNYQHTYPFKDSTDLNVLAANKLGIVLGKGDSIFDPYANITRQEAATMLMRAAKVLNMKAGGDGNTTFTDSSQIADWAAEAVEYICKAGIMNGTGEAFEPDGTYSREQSFMTIYRLFQKVMGQ